MRLLRFLVIAAAYGLIVAGLAAAGAPVEEVTLDPSSVTGSPPYVGVGSKIGHGTARALRRALAGACFAVSMLIDQVWVSRVVEDSFKYLGLTAFLVYVVREAHASFVEPLDAADLRAGRRTTSQA